MGVTELLSSVPTFLTTLNTSIGTLVTGETATLGFLLILPTLGIVSAIIRMIKSLFKFGNGRRR